MHIFGGRRALPSRMIALQSNAPLFGIGTIPNRGAQLLDD